jgi:Na+-transporting methylmalonyl-CoA/oxaloacetate decarboxylase gamma subunit
MRKFSYLIIFLVIAGGMGLVLNELRKSTPRKHEPVEVIKQKVKETRERVKDVIEEIVKEPEKVREAEPEEIQEEALAEQEGIFEELDAEFEAKTGTEKVESIVPQENNEKLTTAQALAIIRALKGEENEDR